MVDNLRLLFGTPILQTSLAVQHRILEFVKSQEFTNHGNGYMTHENFLECSEMKTVKDFITKKVEEYLYLELFTQKLLCLPYHLYIKFDQWNFNRNLEQKNKELAEKTPLPK